MKKRPIYILVWPKLPETPEGADLWARAVRQIGLTTLTTLMQQPYLYRLRRPNPRKRRARRRRE